MPGKRIGFVDNNLENFHANVFLRHIRQDLANRGYTVAGCLALQEQEGRTWAATNDVPYYTTIAELDQAVDCYMVLAPSNPETHLELCQLVLPQSKTTYVDKTFAPDVATARSIFALADQYSAAVQTTSALRYTAVQQQARQSGDPILHMVAWGGGSSFGEYAIHPVEMVVSCMGPEVESLCRRSDEPHSQVLVNFSGDRSATIQVYTSGQTPYAAAFTTATGTQLVTVDTSTLFVDTAAAILDFFNTGTPSIDRAESLAVQRILEAANNPAALNGWIDV
ncbi:MAG: hypothetical protein GKR89_21110 [Candidatus Latescibacteria bacterium]|nr:hypothetical protein [Candidatus Latescibacterota bacterium]